MKKFILYILGFVAVIYILNLVFGVDKLQNIGNSFMQTMKSSDTTLISTVTDKIGEGEKRNVSSDSSSVSIIDVTNIPAFNGENYYIVLNNNIPDLDVTDGSKEFETYSDLDSLGRCGVAYANLSQDTMPTEERGDISDVYPSGWEQEKYEIDGSEVYLYNRSHLIAFCLAGENANEKNLITGTEYMNQQVMTQFENMVADYIDETDSHVLYRVTPIFSGNNLVANGVQMEALSVEDNSSGIEFNVFVYNVEPKVDIDYVTGASSLNPAA